MPRRPLVVLAGWLGSKPQHLKRYEDLYRRAGCDVIHRIAPAYMIVTATLRPAEMIKPPPAWPQKTPVSSSLQNLAWDVLAEIDNRDPPFLFFHTFSNGGCMLWEQIRRLYGLENTLAGENGATVPVTVQKKLRKMKMKTIGVTFDSAPGSELERINEALAYCTWKERCLAVLYGGFDFLSIGSDERVKLRLKRRSREYISTLQSDPWDIPQLYLFSVDDPLAPYHDLDSLVDARIKVFGKERIWKVAWGRSKHCAHLLLHPKEYSEAVQRFISFCIEDNMRSKL